MVYGLRRFRVESSTGEYLDIEIREEEGVLKARFLDDDREYVIRIISFDEELRQAVLEVNGRRIKISGLQSGIVVNGIPSIVKRIIELIPTSISSEKTTRQKKPIKSTEPGVVVTPIAGKIIDVKVKTGERVSEDTVVALLESMKMVTEIKAGVRGVVEKVYVEKGKTVNRGEKIVKINVREKQKN